MPMEEVLTVLLGLSREPGMAPFCAHPGVQVAMQQLVDRIYDAGARIAQLDNPADREGLLNTKVVTPEELWLMNLCADAGKEIATAKGTDPFQVGFARDTVDILHRHFGTHTIKKANKETAPPTPELENLRALVPQAKL